MYMYHMELMKLCLLQTPVQLVVNSVNNLVSCVIYQFAGDGEWSVISFRTLERSEKWTRKCRIGDSMMHRDP